jgi:hypothetical protein
MKYRGIALAIPVAILFLAPQSGVEACGPEWEPEVFVNQKAPDDLAAFAQGRLGILQPGFDSNEYAVAWRYLTGGKLSEDERRAYLPGPEPTQAAQDWTGLTHDQIVAAQSAGVFSGGRALPPGEWLLTRAEYAPPEAPVNAPSFPADFDGNLSADWYYLNCPDAAFRNAILTLTNRAAVWGTQSRWLADWIHAQDAVFSNCQGKTVALPAAAAADSPALLRADRAYQIAAAALYARQYDDAAREFAAIAADPSSPWSNWGGYLAARATVRKAFSLGKSANPYGGDLATYDADTMRRAQQMLEALLARPSPTPSRAAIQGELNFVRIRTEPDRRAAEICAALAGPGPDSSLAQDLADLSWLLGEQIKIQNPPPLLAWIAAWRGAGTAASSYELWQQDRALPWLVVALAKTEPTDPFAPRLVDAAAEIAPGSPAYDTIFYHRVRLLTGLKRADEARALLDAALPSLRHQRPDSRLNALLGERMATARSFAEFLAYAPRTALTTDSEEAGELQEFCNQRAHAVNSPAPCPELRQPLEFDADAAAVLNRHTPLAQLIQAATSPSLPASLRQNIAIMAWVRSVLLEDGASAATFAPLLPDALRKSAGSGTGFSALMAILRNPGVRPYLEAGVPRVASYGAFDVYRDNWWCKPWQENDESGQEHSPVPPLPYFLAAGSPASADAEYQRLMSLPDSATVVGERIIEYANRHPDDPEVPEALALTVRATRYACQDWRDSSPRPGSNDTEYTPTSKAAFELLHRRYPQSPWTTKTRYYY